MEKEEADHIILVGKDIRSASLPQSVTEARQSGDSNLLFPGGHVMNADSFQEAPKNSAAFVFAQPTTQWHHLESPEEGQLAPPDTYQWHSRHSSQDELRSNDTLSVGSSLVDTSALLSPQQRDSGYISQSVRSSGFSHAASSQSGHLSSSQFFDFHDEAWDNSAMDLLANSDHIINEPLWNVSDDPLKGGSEHVAFCPIIEPLPDTTQKSSNISGPDPSRPTSSQRDQPKKQHKRQRSLQSNASKNSKVLGRFACTACREPFTSKYEWARHEGSLCEPQKHWICMLGNDPKIALESGGWKCAFCNATSSDRDEIIGHLSREHDIEKCIRKPIVERTKTREDKFKDHLRKVHRLADGSTHWQRWHRAATPHEKHAWGCGFCGNTLHTWDDRLKHVAEHYENQQLDVSQWSLSHVIRGLLAQNQPDFRMAEAWKRLVGANGDQKLEWPREHAEFLKHKLECHDGSVTDLVLEARGLAVPGHESRKTTSVGRSNSVAVLKPLEKPLPVPPGTARGEPDPSPSYSRLVPQTDVQMQDIL